MYLIFIELSSMFTMKDFFIHRVNEKNSTLLSQILSVSFQKENMYAKSAAGSC